MAITLLQPVAKDRPNTAEISITATFAEALQEDCLGCAILTVNHASDMPTSSGWVQKRNIGNSSQNTSVFVKDLTAGATSVTFGGLGTARGMELHVFPLLGAKPAVDAYHELSDSNGSATNATARTIANPNAVPDRAIVISALNHNGTTGTITCVDAADASTWTVVPSVGVSSGHTSAYQIATAEAIYQAKWAWSVSRFSQAGIFALEAADEVVVVDYGLKMYLSGDGGAITGPHPLLMPS